MHLLSLAQTTTHCIQRQRWKDGKRMNMATHVDISDKHKQTRDRSNHCFNIVSGTGEHCTLLTLKDSIFCSTPKISIAHSYYDWEYGISLLCTYLLTVSP